MADLSPPPDAREPRAMAVAPPSGPAPGDATPAGPLTPPAGVVDVGGEPREPATTPSQLRRFIKSRPWVPMHELRRRFGIDSADDEMTGVVVDGCSIFLGLPPREAAMLGDLIRQGEVGFELIHDPDCPAVAGVFPMRPVLRP